MNKMKAITTKVYEVNGQTYASLDEAKLALKAIQVAEKTMVAKTNLAKALKISVDTVDLIAPDVDSLIDALKAYKMATKAKTVRVPKTKKVKA
jgi:hypothetical protein